MLSNSRSRPINALLTVHIASTVALLGADVVLVLLGIAGHRGADPQAVYPAAYLVGSQLAVPLALASLATGLLLSLLTRRGLFAQLWITIKLLVTAGLGTALMMVLVPRLEAIAKAANAADPISAADRIPLIIAPTATSSLLLAAIALAVFKPRWRLMQRHYIEKRV